VLFSDDVVDLKAKLSRRLRDEAVFAALARSLSNGLSQITIH